MAGQFDVNIVSNNIGALSNDFRPLFKVPSAGGGITILDANYLTESAGTSTVQLVNLGSAGTAVQSGGTLFSGGSAVAVAGIPKAMTVDDTAFVDAGNWVGVQEANTGTTGAITIVTLSYVMGK
jgi:hypothetical protein